MFASTHLQPLLNAAHDAYVWTKTTFEVVFSSFCSLFTPPSSTCTAIVPYSGGASSPKMKRKMKTATTRSIYEVIGHNLRVYLRRVHAQLARLPAQRAYYKALESARKARAGLQTNAKATTASFMRPLARVVFTAAAYLRMTSTPSVGAGWSPYSPGSLGPQSASAIPRVAPKPSLAPLVGNMMTSLRSLYAKSVGFVGSLGRWSVQPLAFVLGAPKAAASRFIPRSPVLKHLKKTTKKAADEPSKKKATEITTSIANATSSARPFSPVAIATYMRLGWAPVYSLGSLGLLSAATTRPPTSLVLTMGSPVA